MHDLHTLRLDDGRSKSHPRVLMIVPSHPLIFATAKPGQAYFSPSRQSENHLVSGVQWSLLLTICRLSCGSMWVDVRTDGINGSSLDVSWSLVLLFTPHLP